jgi:hypothetical protein
MLHAFYMLRPSQNDKMNFRVQVGGSCFLQIFAIYQTKRRRIQKDGKLHIGMCNNIMKKDMDGDYDGLSANTTILFLRTTTLF